MARVSFTANLRRHRPAPTAEAEGATVREVLDRVLADDPLLKGYVLDEQGRLRRHVNVFVAGRMIADRRRLSDPVCPGDEIHVLQALSGG
jgi:molybdopterin converting factor small subunit